MENTFRPGDTVNLDEIDDVAGVAIVNGREVKVHPLDGVAYRMLQRFQNGEETSVMVFYDTVRRCVPDLTADDVDRLTPKQIGALLGIAGARVEGSGFAGEEPASPDATPNGNAA